METNDKIEIKINLTAKDRERAMDYNFFVKRKLVLIDMIFFVILALALIIIKATGILNIPNGLFYAAIGILAMMVFFFIFVKMMSSTGGTGKTRYVTITPETLSTHMSDQKEQTMKWEDFAHKAKTKNYYFLYPDTSQFLIIPKRYFSAGEIEKIDSYIR